MQFERCWVSERLKLPVHAWQICGFARQNGARAPATSAKNLTFLPGLINRDDLRIAPFCAFQWRNSFDLRQIGALVAQSVPFRLRRASGVSGAIR